MRPLRPGGSDAERLLLVAGASERPEPGRMRSAAQGLGLVPRMLTIVAAVVLAVRAAKGSSLGALGVVPLAGAVVLGLTIRAAPGPSVPMPVRSIVPPAPAPVEMRAAPPTPAAPLDEGTTELRVHTPMPLRPAVRPKNPLASPSLTAALREQAGVLDRVRVLVGAGKSDPALAALDDFDRRYARGPLSEESELLRIEALAGRGDRGAASALASAFLRAHPSSVQVDRVTALLQAMAP
ncbi:MAG: hypothetical protein ACRENE_08860 [Polyangiaceae bacterium]